MATKTTELVEIRPMELATVNVQIEGTSPLIMHAWDSKAKQMMLDKQMKKATTTKAAKNPVSDFINSMYWLTPMPEKMTEDAFAEAINNGAKFGFPVTAFKQAAISAAYRRNYVKDKMALRGAFFIKSDASEIYTRDGAVSMDMIEIRSDAPIIREDMVKIAMGTSDIRYRGEFRNWRATLQIVYDINGPFSFEQLVTFINVGGWTCGVGEWRPERDGQYGMYRVVTA
jgi:hypothetical protein